MVEFLRKWENEYKKIRPNSIHVINDATQINILKIYFIYLFIMTEFNSQTGQDKFVLEILKNKKMDIF